jgi:phage terminase large subunit-like protein
MEVGRVSAATGLIRRNHPQFETVFRAAFDNVIAKSTGLNEPSLIERIARLPARARAQVVGSLSLMDCVRLAYAWNEAWAREKQIAPSVRGVSRRIWLLLGGRGSGKNAALSNWFRDRVFAGARTLAIIGPTLTDIGKYQIHGESGLLAAFPPGMKPVHKEDKRLVVFPGFPGVEAHIITAEEPEWRGGNVDTVWWDELAKSKYREKLWDNVEFSARSAESGLDVEIGISTTPLPSPQLKELVLDPDCETVVCDSAENVFADRATMARWQRKYAGTRIGEQEMGGRILTDNPGALFHKTQIEKTRVPVAPPLARVAVAVDPAIATNAENDDTAICAGGIDEHGHVYITVGDAGRWSPEKWGARVLEIYDSEQADCVVDERNRGGDLVASNVRAACLAAGRGAPKIVDVHATRGKEIRAEPVASMLEQGRLHFVGVHLETENEITEWDPTARMKSPNRLDALVWLVYELARLSEDVPDNRAAFEGIEEANQMLEDGRPPPRAVASAPASVAAVPAQKRSEDWERMLEQFNERDAI